MIVVSDTCAITSLLQINRAGLLHEIHKAVLIPRAVERELARSHQTIPSFIESCEVVNRQMVEQLEKELDLGEAEAIVLAKEKHADLLLIDEKLGRRIALREGVRVSGLMALLVEAKQRKLISSMRETVGELETKAGFRVSDAVKQQAFAAANE
jgi:hypothetical protein